jgi:PAS domain S-box-containing protein
MSERNTCTPYNPPKAPPRNSAELLRGGPADMLLARLDIATIVIALDGMVVYANPACERLLGYQSAETLEGQALGTLLVNQSETPPNACIELLRDPDIVTNWNHSDGYAIATLASDSMMLSLAEPVMMVSLTDVSDRVWAAVNRAKHFLL